MILGQTLKNPDRTRWACDRRAFRWARLAVDLAIGGLRREQQVVDAPPPLATGKDAGAMECALWLTPLLLSRS
jgi:hypothetical protein